MNTIHIKSLPVRNSTKKSLKFGSFQSPGIRRCFAVCPYFSMEMYCIQFHWLEGSEKNPISWFANESTWRIAGEYFSASLTKRHSMILLYRPVLSVVENLFVGHQQYFCRCYTCKFQPVPEFLPFLTDTYHA